MCTQNPHLTANEWAERFLNTARGTGKQSVTNTDLRQYVQTQSGQTRESVSGTLDGTGSDALSESPWYLATWYKDKSLNGRITHRLRAGSEDAIRLREKDYDFPQHRAACERVMFWLPASGTPRVLTRALAHGNSVQAAYARNPDVQIDNIEHRPEVLRLWQVRKQQLGVQTNDIESKLSKFLLAPDFNSAQYALIDIDEKGYASEKMFDYLAVINRQKSCPILVITVQWLSGFRNHGKFIAKIRQEYAEIDDPHVQSIVDHLTNYQMVDRDEYNDGDRSKLMEYLIFQLDPRI
jgi:hypothetical protein